MIPTTNNQATVVRTERGLSVAGTRITLYPIMDYMSAGYSTAYIRNLYNLSEQQMVDVLAYIADHQLEVEVEYQQVLHDAEQTHHFWEEHNHERLAALAGRPRRPEIEAAGGKVAARRAPRQPK